MKPFDVVALLEDMPAKGLLRGQVGTVVEKLAPEMFEVEFCDNDGKTYASVSLSAKSVLVLHHEPAQVG